MASEHGTLYQLATDLSATINSHSILPAGGTTVPQDELPFDSTAGAPCANITNEVGITGTPVIDAKPPTSTGDPIMFAVVKSKSSTLSYRQTIHAWDFIGSPNTDVSFDLGAALGWTTGSITTNQFALMQNQRAGLALTHDSNGNAIIYVAWGSHCDSSTIPNQLATFPYYGWVAAVKFDYSTSSFSAAGLLHRRAYEPGLRRQGRNMDVRGGACHRFQR